MYDIDKKLGRPTSLYGKKHQRTVTLTDEAIKRGLYLAFQMARESESGAVSLSSFLEATIHRLYEEDYQRRADNGEMMEEED